jgi:hypothetical protein
LNKLIGEIAQRKTFQQALQFGRWLELRIPAEGCSPMQPRQLMLR